MRLAFMGTPEFAAASLSELLAAGHEIAAVYTRAPQRSGRGQKLHRTPVHVLAEANNLEIRAPKNFKDDETRIEFAALDVDAAIVVAYGLILPKEVLDAPRIGAFNLHASLLPRWRGAAPIQRAIMAGDKQTGVQIMRMEVGLDTGPIVLSETVAIQPDDTAQSLHDRLAFVGAQLLPRALSALERDALVETAQQKNGVIYAEKILPKEACIDWSRPAAEVDCHIRGLSPFPGAWFWTSAEAGKQRVKVLMSTLNSAVGSPGEILMADERLIIACGDGAVELKRLQRAGRNAQDAREFLRGVPLRRGQVL